MSWARSRANASREPGVSNEQKKEYIEVTTRLKLLTDR